MSLVMGGEKYHIASGSNDGVSKCMPCKRRTVAWLVGLVIMILMCAVINLSVLLHFARQIPEAPGAKPLLTKDGGGFCSTSTCISSAHRVVQGMNPENNPCDNFYEYACGGWESKVQQPSNSVHGWSVLDELESENDLFFKEQLEKPVRSSSYKPYQKIRALYGSCMNPPILQRSAGLTEVREFLDGLLAGFSFNNSTTMGPDYDLTDTLIQLIGVNYYPLFKLTADFDRYNKDTLILQVLPPDSIVLYSKQEGLSLWKMILEEYYKVFQALFKESSVSPDASIFVGLADSMNLLKETLNHDVIASFAAPWNDTLATVADLQNMTGPGIDWHRLFEALYNEVPENILVPNYAYMMGLNILLRTAPSRDLYNAILFRFVLKNLEYFNEEYTAFLDNLTNRILKMKEVMPGVMSHLYITEYLEDRDSVVEDIESMIDHIRSAYIEILQATDLLDESTRLYAIHKVKSMEQQIAYPSYVTNTTYLEIAYDHVVVNQSSFWLNVLASRQRSHALKQPGIVTELDDEAKADFFHETFIVNAYYSKNFNRFTILAGILQGQFYSYGNPQFLNYGSIGFTIAHEFTHGFDDTGRHYDVNGLFKSWWTDESEDQFAQVKECFTRQYSGLEVKAFESNITHSSNEIVIVAEAVPFITKINATTDGNATLDENLADNGALQVIYRAYELRQSKHQQEPILTIDDLVTWQQQFFTRLAQGWCAKFSPSGVDMFLSSAVHSQKEARVNGLLRNSPQFADAFKCPLGTAMNPSAKCTLW